MSKKPILKRQPFRATPILSGEDASLFLEKAENPDRASDKERKRIEESYESIKSIAAFPMP